MNPTPEEALFVLALKKPADKRPAFQDAVCEGDTALRACLDPVPKHIARRVLNHFHPAVTGRILLRKEVDLKDSAAMACSLGMRTVGRSDIPPLTFGTWRPLGPCPLGSL